MASWVTNPNLLLQLSLLYCLQLHDTFLDFSRKEQTIFLVLFPTPSAPLPHKHEHNGNVLDPRNSCTLYFKTAPPRADSPSSHLTCYTT